MPQTFEMCDGARILCCSTDTVFLCGVTTRRCQASDGKFWDLCQDLIRGVRACVCVCVVCARVESERVRVREGVCEVTDVRRLSAESD